jgi:hypothetical protein
MIKYFEILKEIVKKGNYSLISNITAFIGIGAAVYHLIFILLDELIGSSQFLTLRLAGILISLILTMPFFKKAHFFYIKVFYECILAISLSQIIILFMFIEYTPVYLYNGVLIGGFLYSLLSGYFLVPIMSYPLMYIGGYYFVTIFKDSGTVTHFSDSMGIFFVAYFASICGLALRAGFDVFYYLRIALDEQRVRLESIKQLNEITNQKIRIQHEIDNLKDAESIGEFASGITHDFNNILYVIGLHTMLLNRSAENTWEKEKTELIAQTVKQNSDLIKTLLAFTRKNQNPVEQINLANIIQTSIDLANVSSMKKYIDFEKYQSVMSIDGDVQLLQNGLINLLINLVNDLRPDVMINVKLNRIVNVISSNMDMQKTDVTKENHVSIQIKINHRKCENYIRTDFQEAITSMAKILERFNGHLVLEHVDCQSFITLQMPESKTGT